MLSAAVIRFAIPAPRALCALALAWLAARQEPTAPAQVFLAPGPAFDALEKSSDAATDPAPALRLPPGLDDPCWTDPSAFRDWLARARRAGSNPDAQAAALDHAWLACFALETWRPDQAWDHFARAAAAPGVAQALLPRFFLGARSVQQAPGWMRLEAGALLQPSLPPSNAWSDELPRGTGRLERRAMRVVGLSVGQTVLDFAVGVEYDGLQIELDYKSGPGASISVEFPAVAEFTARALLLDWERQSVEARLPLRTTVEVSEKKPEQTLYVQLAPRPLSMNATLPRTIPASWRHHGVRFVGHPAPERSAIWAAFALALGEELKLDCRFEPRDPPGTPGTPGTPGGSAARAEFPGAVFELGEPDEQSLRLGHWMAQLERLVSSPAPR